MKEKKVKITKSQKLYNKVNDLVTKIENEPNVIKRTLYSIKAKLVLAKIQRQIDIQDIRDKYDTDRNQNDLDAEIAELDTRDDIIDLTSRINTLQDIININSDYDYESSRFMFGKSDVERKGGIDNYIKRLRQSGRIQQVDAASQMQYVENLKRELRAKQAELADKQGILAGIDKDRKDKNRASKVEETALVVNKKINIFARISNFFKKIVEGIKEGKTQSQAVKNEKAKGIERTEGQMETRKDALAKLEEEYQKRRAEILEEYDRAEQNFKDGQAREQANKFREELKEMANKRGFEVKTEELEQQESREKEEKGEETKKDEATR